MKKIGFIAMSGVRAHNPELTQLGLTLPGFVDRNRIVASMPSLGLLTLAGLTPPHFAIEYREIADLRELGGLPEDYDLVAPTHLLLLLLRRPVWSAAGLGLQAVSPFAGRTGFARCRDRLTRKRHQSRAPWKCPRLLPCHRPARTR